MVKLGGSYLKAADVKNGDLVRFISEGGWMASAKFTYEDGKPRQDFVIDVEHQGIKKSMKLNKTNRDALKAAWNDETRDWIGREARVETVQALISGKLQLVIVLKPIVGPVTAKEIGWDDK